MHQTHAEDRNAAPPATNRLDGDAGFLRRAGSGRDDDCRRRELADLVDRDGIVAPHDDVHAKLAQILNEVVREGVVIVDDENHGGTGCWYWVQDLTPLDDTACAPV